MYSVFPQTLGSEQLNEVFFPICPVTMTARRKKKGLQIHPKTRSTVARELIHGDIT
jgi:hypothetical protein